MRLPTTSFISGVCSARPHHAGFFTLSCGSRAWSVGSLQARTMDARSALLDRHHGLVRTVELLEIGTDTEILRWLDGYGALVHVRQGWWARPGSPDRLLRAWRAGGRLACVSALAFHGYQLELGEPLHIELPASSRGPREPGVIAHWSRDQRNGDRRAVSIEVALRQASRCRAANGTL